MNKIFFLSITLLASLTVYAGETHLKPGDSVYIGGNKILCESTHNTPLPKCELEETSGSGSRSGTHEVKMDGLTVAVFEQNWNSHSAWEARHNQALEFCRDLEARKKCICNF